MKTLARTAAALLAVCITACSSADVSDESEAPIVERAGDVGAPGTDTSCTKVVLKAAKLVGLGARGFLESPRINVVLDVANGIAITKAGLSLRGGVYNEASGDQYVSSNSKLSIKGGWHEASVDAASVYTMDAQPREWTHYPAAPTGFRRVAFEIPVDAHALGLADANQNQIAIQLQPFVVDAGRGPYVDDNYDFGAHAKGDDNDRATLSQVATFTATESAYCRGH